MHPISIATSFSYDIPLAAQLPLIKAAGFSYVSLGGNYEHSGILETGRLRELQQLLADNGLAVDTLHGYNMDKPDTLEVNKKIVYAAGVLQAPVVVLHTSAFTFAPAAFLERAERLGQLLPVFTQMAKEAGVCFALENIMPGPASDFMEAVLQQADPCCFGFCYDSSHDQLDGPRSFALLERNMGRLKAVHISDRIGPFRDHVIPGEGFVDFAALAHLLRKANMRFPLLMEVMMTHSKYQRAEEFLAQAYRAAERLLTVIREVKK